ncbi:MAG: hypothetical protein R2771_16265 [Saprospiraceae bacterium]
MSLAYKDRYDTWYENKGMQMMWTDISDPRDIHIKKIVEFKDIVPNTMESFVLQRFSSINNTIYLGHRYPNFDIEEFCAYILWLDSYR